MFRQGLQDLHDSFPEAHINWAKLVEKLNVSSELYKPPDWVAEPDSQQSFLVGRRRE